MSMVRETVSVKADRATVFDAYVNEMSAWWPWKGRFTYSFAPEGTSPESIILEGRLGGRFFERFADGTEHQIGTVTSWRPPDEVAYTWEVEGWRNPSTITVRFVDDGDATTVVVEHTRLPDAESERGYSEGHREILAKFAVYASARFPANRD
ncbi:MAG: SRPBCC domain-containing protein [Acidimicrobiia bacterium]